MPTRRRIVAISLALAWIALPGAAPAEPEPAVLEPGQISLGAILDVNLSSDSVFEPVELAPDLLYGAAPRLEIGIVHSGIRTTGFYASQGGGLCLTGTDGGCIDTYDNPALLGRYLLIDGELAVAADGGLVVRSLDDPFALSFKAGLVVQLQLGALWLESAPNLFIGLTGRTIEGSGGDVAFNRERVHLPLAIGYGISEAFDAFVQVGIASALDGFADSFTGPVAAGARYDVGDSLSVLAWFGFDNLIGNDGTLDARRIAIGARYRLGGS
jgi:hypothetical protein